MMRDGITPETAFEKDRFKRRDRFSAAVCMILDWPG
jgi:hypothetical protein